MEEVLIPSLEKTTSVGIQLPERENSDEHKNFSKQKIESLPQLPEANPSFMNKKLKLSKKISCFDRYRGEQSQSSEERANLYSKIYHMINEMIENPAKITMLLSALQSMENSIKSNRRSRASIDSKGNGQKPTKKKSLEQHMQCSIESQNLHKMANSLELQHGQGEDKLISLKASYGICDFMAESIEIEYPYNDTIGCDKLSYAGSQQMKQTSLSGVKSMEEEMLDSFKIPEFSSIYKKISILLIDDEGSEMFSSSSSLQSLSRIDLPKLDFNEELIVAIFGDASPFLINLALCLLFKFILKSKFKLDLENVGWILGISAIVSYKIYYDQTLQGILDYFSSVLLLNSDDVTYLQRWFLQELNYEVLINNKHYTEIMMKLLKNQ